ncbi:50S ribosomal protein L20, partial [Candidatus Gracilibacteria bacterium]|nr:50S ribosomal protein L20 [Candidatus Gracilibacteria bacterium]
MRIKGGTTTRARHKKVLKSTKGYRGRQKNTFRVAKQANMKAGLHAYRGRKL